MNDETKPFDRLAGGLERPRLPPALRHPVLAAASAALSRPDRPDFWTAVRSSHPARFVWAAAVLLLVVANLLVPLTSSRGSIRGQSIASLHAEGGGELGDVLELPRIDRGARSLSELVALESRGEGERSPR